MRYTIDSDYIPEVLDSELLAYGDDWGDIMCDIEEKYKECIDEDYQEYLYKCEENGTEALPQDEWEEEYDILWKYYEKDKED